MYHSVDFGAYNSYDDWGLYLAEPVTVSPPEVYTYMVDVPGRNGALDLTESLTGDVSYYDREISCKFVCQAPRPQWPDIHAKIMNAIHGRRMEISISDDPDYKYEGRVYVDEWGTEYGDKMEFPVIRATVAPYAMEKEIREYTVNLSTTGSQTVDVTGDDVSKQDWNTDFRWGTAEIPTFNWSAYNSMTIKCTTYPNRMTSWGLQIVDAEGNVYNKTYTKTARTESTTTVTMSKSVLEDAGITWEKIYRLLLQNIQSATVTATIASVASVTVDGTYKPAVPIIDTSIACTMTVKGQTYELEAGTWQSDDLVIDSSGATFTFKAENPASSATASVKFRGGKL